MASLLGRVVLVVGGRGKYSARVCHNLKFSYEFSATAFSTSSSSKWAEKSSQQQQQQATRKGGHDSLDKKVLAFVGGGKIAQAIIFGLIKQEKLRPEQIYVSDVNMHQLRATSPIFTKYKINWVESNAELLRASLTVVMCVKPNHMSSVLDDIASHVSRDHLIISLAAGIRLQQIERALPEHARVVRIMTNINAFIQQSTSVFTLGKRARSNADDAKSVRELLSVIGQCEDEIAEDLMDVFTALGGSGPAFMYLVLDALADGAVKMGMSRQQALSIATQTMLGSAMQVKAELANAAHGRHVMQMKEEVCSPSGTSIHGIAELEKHGVRGALMKCIEAATLRANELSSKQPTSSNN